MRESKVETYLKRRVKAKGGLIRKLKWISCRNAPDDFVVLFGQVWLVECKAPSKKPRKGQDREHDRLRDAGVNVAVVSTLEEVDALMVSIETGRLLQINTFNPYYAAAKIVYPNRYQNVEGPISMRPGQLVDKKI